MSKETNSSNPEVLKDFVITEFSLMPDGSFEPGGYYVGSPKDPNRLGPKLLPFKPKPEPIAMSPQEDVLDQAYEIRGQIKNIAILVHLENGSLKVFNAIDESIELANFIEIFRTRSILATEQYLNGPQPSSPATA